MRCPHCDQASLAEQQTRHGVVLDVCQHCHGVWLDRGMIYEFSNHPQALERALSHGLRDRELTNHQCPRCETVLQRGTLPDRDAIVEECPTCGGLWMSSRELEHARAGSSLRPPGASEPVLDEARLRDVARWDEFLVDLFVLLLPWLALLAAAGVVAGAWAAWGAAWEPQRWLLATLGAGIGAAGLGSLLKTNLVYRREYFPHLSVAALMHRVKVSNVRPVPATLTGTIIAKGVPEVIGPRNVVLRDQTGALFLDHQHPLAIWDSLLGLLRLGQYEGKCVRVSGWFYQVPVPYLALYRIETLDGSMGPRRCCALRARLIGAGVLTALGAAVAVVGMVV